MVPDSGENREDFEMEAPAIASDQDSVVPSGLFVSRISTQDCVMG
jgi:hypothetical protein